MTKQYFTSKEKKELLSKVGDIEEGATIHTHHCKDGEGNDRCYITRYPDAYVFYCHHCDKRGATHEAYGRFKRHKKSLSLGSEGVSLPHGTLPPDVTYDRGEWGLRAKVWLAKGSISDQEVNDRGIGYSPSLDRVILPVVYQGELQGYVARGVAEEATPKYLAKYKSKDTFIYHIDRGSEEVILVEDILSCIRVARVGYSCVAMLGATVSDPLFNLLVSKYKRWGIWSDYDNPSVKMQAHRLSQRLSLFGEVRMIISEKDPKELKDEEIEECLSLK